MVNLQLFVVVLASFFWDGQALECAYREQSEQFCLHVNESYQLNNSSEHLFTGDKFKDDRERISRANEKVLAVLKLSKKSAVKKALCSALESETTAVFSAGVSCSGSEKTTDACELGLTGLCLAVEEQVKAFIEITKGKKKKQVGDALKAYEAKENKTDKVTWSEQANDLGRSVSKIIPC